MSLAEETIVEGLSDYLTGRLTEHPVAVTDVRRHTEGWSRRTVSFTANWEADGRDRSERFVARIENEPRDDDALDTRNDIEVEFRTMDAVSEADAGVPVPETYWFESDESHLGGRFFVVGHCPGEAPITWDREDRQRLYGAWDSEERTLPHQFVDAAAAVHSLDAADVPVLEDPPLGEVVDRELDTQARIYRKAKLKDEPAVREVFRWLRENRPTVPEKTLVHGDFRVGNMLVDGDDLAAVLDWELARIGDPMYDLGYASTNYFAGKLVEPIERPELACSLLEREWFYEEYERRTGREVDRERVHYWRVFSALRMMLGGIGGAHRFHTGDSDDVRSAWFQYIVPTHVEDLLELVRDDRVV